jgi:hypothetical protein
VADRAGAGQGLAEARVAVSGNFRNTGVSVGVGERAEDAVGAGVEVNAVNGEEGDDRRIRVRAGGNVGRRKGVLSKCLRDISRPVIRRPRLGIDGAAVGTPCSGVLPGAQWV